MYVRNVYLVADPYLLHQRCFNSHVKDFTIIIGSRILLQVNRINQIK